MSNLDESSWITWYCSLSRNEFLCQVDEKYIGDKFNLKGLCTQVEQYQPALNMILDVDGPGDGDVVDHEALQKSAEMLYGLIHARYIMTSAGCQRMLEKYHKMQFGRCPRVYCEAQAMLPVGLTDKPNVAMVKLYCPRCSDVYHPHGNIGLDGAYFGTGFPHMLYMTYPSLRPTPSAKHHVNRLFGFKIHYSAYKSIPVEDGEEVAEVAEMPTTSSPVVSPQDSLSKVSSLGKRARCEAADIDGVLESQVLTKVLKQDYNSSTDKEGF